MLTPWGLVGLAALLVSGCAGSFDIAPAELPNLGSAGARVRTIDGETREVPYYWDATIVAHDPPGQMPVRDPTTAQVRMAREVGFSDSDDYDIVDVGQPLHASQSDEPMSPPRRLGSATVRIRYEGRTNTLEIPLASIARVRVRDSSDDGGSGSGDVSIILLGLIAGAATVASTVLLSAAMDGVGGDPDD